MLNLYLVSEGDVTDATPETEFDGINSVIVAAQTPAEALELVGQFERGEIGIDNIAGPACGYAQGITIVGLQAR